MVKDKNKEGITITNIKGGLEEFVRVVRGHWIEFIILDIGCNI